MRAQVGDRILVLPGEVGSGVKDGEVVEVPNDDGSPPYSVRWSDGSIGLVLLGTERSGEDRAVTIDLPAPRAGEGTGGPPAKRWQVQLSVLEVGDETRATAVLVDGTAPALTARGTCHRRRTHRPVPEIGDEVAVARALRGLADTLLEVASADIHSVTGERAQLTPS